MAGKVSIAAIAVLVLIGGLLLAGNWSLHRHEMQMCGICQRHINAQSEVIAEVGGKTRHVCCAHCAVTEGLQEHKPVKLLQVTDRNSGKKIDPTSAWYVEGSRAVACEHDMAHMNEMKQVERTAFDRCSPGTFAFAKRSEAEAFVGEMGGTIRSLDEMLAAVNAGEVQK